MSWQVVYSRHAQKDAKKPAKSNLKKKAQKLKKKMTVDYKTTSEITTDQFIDLLHRSGLAERRPVEDRECMKGMVENSNLVATAWDGEKLIGIARSMTDFHYACYLSDLAIDRDYQGKGVGKTLQAITQEKLGPKCNLILVAAPSADSYYGHIGFTNNPRCWVLERNQTISS